MSYFKHNGLSFHFIEKGEGKPFIFQHGLGGSVEQIIKIYTPPPGIRLIAFDFRAHGKTSINGTNGLNFKAFADDVLALMNHLHLSKAIIGGVSMGAGVALNFTLRYPDRVEALILSRPAWLDGPMEKQNRELYKLISELIREHGPGRGRELFIKSDEYDQLSKTFPVTAQALLGNFDYEKAFETAVKFELLPADEPSDDREEWKKIKVPTLILANKSDPVHPFEYGLEYASKISHVKLKEITSKSISEEQHNKDVQESIDLFLATFEAKKFTQSSKSKDMNIWQQFPDNRILAELSLWSADFANFNSEMERMEPYADLYHIDVADGHFAPQFLFFPDLVARLRPLTKKPFHVHLMVENNILLSQIDQFIEAGANLITIWYENGEIVPEALDRIHHANITAGMSIGLETPPEVLIPFLNRIDLVTIMGTRVGVKGQDLDENAPARMRQTQQLIEKHGYSNKIKLAADGGNRLHTVPALRAAGADTVVMGSLAYNSKNLQETFDWLWSLPKLKKEEIKSGGTINTKIIS